VLWGAWLVTLFAVFSAITTINAYYTAALSPPVAAIIGAGTAAAWSGERTAVARPVGLELVVAGTAGYAAWLVSSSGARVPGWLVPAIIAVAAAAIGISVWSLLAPRAGVWAGALAAGLVSVALVPAVASASLAASSQGAFDTPFEPTRTAQAVEQARHKVAAFSVTPLQSQQDGAPYLMAADPRDRVGGHDHVQAVGAEQIAVAGAGLAELEVRPGGVVAGERPEQQQPLRVRGDLLGGDLPLVQ
jgi:4-amino-4-deoxy-L-arabinose transferase-like glycosyltransferase